MMNRCFFNLVFFLLMIGGTLSACSSDENDDPSNGWLSEMDKDAASDSNSIIGTWELYALAYPADMLEVTPLNQRDLYIFGSNGKVRVIKKRRSFFQNYFPDEDGEYDYSYDKEKKIIHFFGKDRYCNISDGEMLIESGWSSASGEPVQWFIFKKK